MSVGIMCKSLQKNQYSFQNHKSICFYSYFYGYFRGYYNKGKYETLEWPL